MLLRFSLKDWFSRRQPTSATRRFGRTREALTLESLETRLVPVVGAKSWAPMVARGTGYDGVVRIIGPGCTGNLLTTGRHILTAAHCLTDSAGAINQPSVTVRFEMPGRNGNPARDIDIAVSSSDYLIHPNWNGNAGNGNDLALLELPYLAPSGPAGAQGPGAERYDFYRYSDEVGQIYDYAGYGNTGTGSTGQVVGTAGTKRFGRNHFSAVQCGGKCLGADFDSGSWIDNPHGDPYYLGDLETAIAQGDSGGGLLLGGRHIAGVNSYMWWDHFGSPPQFGDTSAFTRVSQFTGWLDDKLDDGHALVLDMKQQLEGDDGSPDTIEARVNGANFELWVNGVLYQAEPFAQVAFVSILGSDDVDTITVSPLAFRQVTVDGRGGADKLTVVGMAGPDNWTIRDNIIGPTLSNYKVTFQSIAAVTTSTLAGNDSIWVPATLSNVTYKIDAGADDDTIELGDVNASGYRVLDQVLGSVDVAGGTGADTLNLEDEGQSAGKEYTITNTAVRRNDQWLSVYSYQSVNTVQLFTGNGADKFFIGSTSFGSTLKLWAGGGSDTLIGPNASVDWYIGDNNQIYFLPAYFQGLPFGGVTAYYTENARGGSGADQFHFSAGKWLSGSVDGILGGDKLDYSTWSTPLFVNLTTGSATGVGGSVSHVLHVTGGSGNDILIGNTLPNTLVGGGGRDLLIGGSGADVLDGGLGDDLLIGGWTFYDSNTTALNALRTVWSNLAKSYADRVADLRAGTGLPFGVYLTSDTVRDDAAQDILSGGTGFTGGQDWFWAQQGSGVVDILADLEANEQTN